MNNKLKNLTIQVLVFYCLLYSNSQAITLYEVVETTVLTNPSILEMYNQKISREYEVEVAHGGYLPKLVLDASGGYKRVQGDIAQSTMNGRADTYRTANATITLKQMLFDGYLTQSEKARQQKRVESAFFELYNLAEETAIRAIEVYVNVLLYQKFLEFAEKNLKSHEKMYEQIEMRSMLGADDKSSLSQMTGRLKLAFSNVESERNNLQDRWTEFVEVVGFTPKDALEDVEFDLVLPETYQETLDYALANHPALARSKADIEQFKLQKKASENFYYPRLELNLQSSWTRNYGFESRTVYDKRNEQSALLSLNWNLYNGGADKARTEKDQFLRQEADEHLEWQRRRTEKDVAFAWNTYKSSSRRLSYLQDYVSATSETSGAYLQQFQIGERTLLDILNTENEVFDASKELLTVKYQNILAKYRVLASMGILLEKTRIKLVTDEYYRTDDINAEQPNDFPEKRADHNERELEKRDSSDDYTDMRFFKMNNNVRTPFSDAKYAKPEINSSDKTDGK